MEAWCSCKNDACNPKLFTQFHTLSETVVWNWQLQYAMDVTGLHIFRKGWKKLTSGKVTKGLQHSSYCLQYIIKCSKFACLNSVVIFRAAWFQIGKMLCCSSFLLTFIFGYCHRRDNVSCNRLVSPAIGFLYWVFHCISRDHKGSLTFPSCLFSRFVQAILS